MNAPESQRLTESTPLVLRADAGGVTTLTLNRPRQFNAMSDALLAALAESLEAVAADEQARVVVLAGAGSAFSGGHDLKEMMAQRNAAFLDGLFARCSAVMQRLATLPQPVIARVHGIATAAGCQLVAACDLAVATDDSRFATSGVNYGLFCATPAVPLSRNVSRKRAFEMLVTGEFIDAATAREWGLVNRVVPAAELDAEIARLAAAILAKPRRVIADGKALFYAQLAKAERDAYAEASRSIACNMLAPEAGEGVQAFIEKRKPSWS